MGYFGCDKDYLWKNDMQTKNTVEDFLSYDYRTLKNYINMMDEDVMKALKDTRIKKKLINCSSDYELGWLTQGISDKAARILFDEEGIAILSRSLDMMHKLDGIITSGKDYVGDLVKKDSFCELLLINLGKLSFSSMDASMALNIVNYVIKNREELVDKVFGKFSSDVQKKLVSEVEFPVEITKKFLGSLSLSSMQYVLDNDLRITSLSDYDFKNLYSIFASGCRIPVALLEEDNLVRKIVTMESAKSYRFIINELVKNHDVSNIELLRKKYCDSQFASYDKDKGMLKRYSLCYKELCDLISNECSYSYNNMSMVVNKYLNLFDPNDCEFLDRIDFLCNLGNKDKLKDFFVRESNLQISNMIIDYHFEEVSYNFLVDVAQLCDFQAKLGKDRTLNSEDLDIYRKLLNIDKLSYDEKILLHKRLNGKDFVSKHYDVFREAKDKAYGLIGEQMLSKESIGKYYDEELSKKYGVDVYTLNGDYFIALVKSLRVRKNRVLEQDDLRYYVDGSSYSLDGSSKLDTFYDPCINYNLIYGNFPEEQITHIFPVDSFSSYVRENSERSTNRVNYLVTPDDLVNLSAEYNEIVMVQKNNCRSDELNSKLGVPSILGIYCYDFIRNLDVESAKNLDCSIVLVKTKNYDKSSNKRKINMCDTMCLGGDYVDNYFYIDNVNCDDMRVRRK